MRIQKLRVLSVLLVLLMFLSQIIIPTSNVIADDNVAIQFADQKMYEEMKIQLNTKMSSYDDAELKINMTQSQIDSVTRLELINDISDINGLEYFTNLTSLSLGNGSTTKDHSISDFSPISNLTKLTYLNIDSGVSSKTPLVNLDVFSKLVNLEYFSAFNMGIEDISAVSNFTKLKELGLQRNNFSDISALSGLTDLENIDFAFDNNLSDITPLTNCVNIKTITFFNDALHDLSPLRNMNKIESLGLGQCNQLNSDAINEIGKLTTLKTLNLSYTRVQDVNGLSSLKNLTSLNLTSNGIKNLDFVSNFTKLKNFYCSYNSIKDFSFLEGLANLDTVNISNQSYTNYVKANNLDIDGTTEINLPESFIKSKDINSCMYTSESTIECTNCTLSADGTKLIVNNSDLLAQLNGSIVIKAIIKSDNDDSSNGVYDTRLTISAKKEYLTILNLPTSATTYYQNTGALNLQNASFIYHNIDNVDQTISMTDPGVTVTGFDNTKLGVQELTIHYNGVEKTFNVTVKAPTLLNISLINEPTKKEYIQNKDSLDANGGKIQLVYDDTASNTTIDVTNDMITGFDNTKTGNQTLTINYLGKTVTYDIKIVEETKQDPEEEETTKDDSDGTDKDDTKPDDKKQDDTKPEVTQPDNKKPDSIVNDQKPVENTTNIQIVDINGNTKPITQTQDIKQDTYKTNVPKTGDSTNSLLRITITLMLSAALVLVERRIHIIKKCQ